MNHLIVNLMLLRFLLELSFGVSNKMFPEPALIHPEAFSKLNQNQLATIEYSSIQTKFGYFHQNPVILPTNEKVSLTSFGSETNPLNFSQTSLHHLHAATGTT